MNGYQKEWVIIVDNVSEGRYELYLNLKFIARFSSEDEALHAMTQLKGTMQEHGQPCSGLYLEKRTPRFRRN